MGRTCAAQRTHSDVARGTHENRESVREAARHTSRSATAARSLRARDWSPMKRIALLACLLGAACAPETLESELPLDTDVALGTSSAALTITPIIDDFRRLYAVEVSECGDDDTGGARSVTLPYWVTGAAIIDNGFAHRYRSKDHHVKDVYNHI